jgi:hypothetical protein
MRESQAQPLGMARTVDLTQAETGIISVDVIRVQAQKMEADEGVGRGPGGPPHAPMFFDVSRTFPTIAGPSLVNRRS